MHKTLILVGLLLATTLHAQKGEDPNAGKTEQIRKNTYEKVSIQLSLPITPDAVRAALLQRKPEINQRGCDLMLTHDIASPYARHIDFAQTYNGIPLYFAGLKATVNNTGRIISLLNILQQFSGTPQAFTRTTAAVADQLPTMFNEGYPDFNIEENVRLYFPQEGLLVPVHKIVYTSNTFTWEVLLADSDLHEIQRRDLAAYHHSQLPLDTPGTGFIFNPDPLTSSGQVYGAPYNDNGDATNPQLDAERISVTLKDLTFNAGNFLLQGPYVKLEDRESLVIAIATSATGNFSFTRNQTGFEDVMVYYHIDSMQRYVQSLGFTNMCDFPISADPHGLNTADNSHFIGGSQITDSRLAFGIGGVDDAEDADVIVHEYGHALSHCASPNGNTGQERQGIDEGIGDYQAASYSRGISYTFWKNTFTWDGHNEFWPGRSASDPTMYPPSNTSIYTYGSIWASVLMEVWGQIGKTASDKVFFQSLYNLGPFLTLTDAAHVVLDADSIIFGGAYHEQYQLAFCNRGILTGTMPGGACALATGDALHTELSWKIFPNPAQDQITIELQPMTMAAHPKFAIFDAIGRKIQQGELQNATQSITLGDLKPGIYMLQLLAKDGRTDTQKLVIK
jgi:zinc metalloprotease ZmpB